jgi:hypothetical protein
MAELASIKGVIWSISDEFLGFEGFREAYVSETRAGFVDRERRSFHEASGMARSGWMIMESREPESLGGITRLPVGVSPWTNRFVCPYS